jgi:hypothetical protein
MSSKISTNRQQLLERMERTSGARREPKVRLGVSNGGARTSTRRHHQRDDDKRTVDQVMQFEIVGTDHPEVLSGQRPPDDVLVTMLKQEINSVGLSRRDLYAFVGEGEGMLFENENQAYNLEYGLRKRPTISLDCASRWLAVIGKEMQIAFVPIDEES